MATFGRRPEDVVADSRGNTLRGVTLAFYASEAAARSGATPIGVATTDALGRWSFDTTSATLWARTPNGDVWELVDPAVIDTGHVDHGSVGGALTINAADSTHSLTLISDAAVTLTGAVPGRSVAIFATGSHSLTVMGVAVPSLQCVAIYMGGEWYVKPIVGAQTPPVEPVTVVASTPVADDTANTWTWTPTTGVEYVVDGAVQPTDASSYSIGDVTILSTITAQAMPGYVLSAPVSVTFQFNGSAPAYSTTVLGDGPLHYFAMDDAVGTTTPVNQGSATTGNTLTVAGTTGLAFGAAGIGVGATSVEITSGGDSYFALDSRFSQTLTAYSAEAVVHAGSGAFHIVCEGTGLDLYYNSAGTQFAVVVNTNWNVVSSALNSPTGSAPLNSTYHVAMTYDSTTLRLYLNGSEVATLAASRTGASNSASSMTGVTARGDGVYKGQSTWSLAGLALYDKVLTSAQVLAHAQAAGVA